MEHQQYIVSYHLGSVFVSVFTLSYLVVCGARTHVHGGGVGGADLVMLSSVSAHWGKAGLFFTCICLFEHVGKCLSKEILRQLYRQIPEGGVYKHSRLRTQTYTAESWKY